MVRPAPQHVKPPPLKDFEEVLSHVGGWGCYQMILLFFFFIFCAFTAYVTYIPVIFLYVPDHWCKPHPSFQDSGLSPEVVLNLTVPFNENGKREQCSMYNITMQEVSVLMNLLTHQVNRWSLVSQHDVRPSVRCIKSATS